MKKQAQCCVYLGDELARYGFGDNHPFGPQRHYVFEQAFYNNSLQKKVDILKPQTVDSKILRLFHTSEYIEKVKKQSRSGIGFLDQGDTPAFIGVYMAAATVVGSVCDAIDRLIATQYKRAFIPIAGLHHARPNTAAGFCVFNDCGVAIEYLRDKYQIQHIAYVDIDAHHADGVFYSFEADPELIFADMHEDGRFLYPGTGDAIETGVGPAKGTKLNIPMPPDAHDDDFKRAWQTVEKFLLKQGADFILFQCGADSIKGDPITHLAYSEKSHAFAAERLRLLANKMCDGKLLAMGGGGYNLYNIAKTWPLVVERMSV